MILFLVLAAAAAQIEQTAQGPRPAAGMIVSFDGMSGRNPSDNSLAVGPSHVMEIVNSQMSVYDKQGKVLYGPVPTNTVFKGFGGRCEANNNGDAVARYDQLARRWLIVMPLFRRDPDNSQPPYSMCYAVSKSGDPMGEYHRYEFKRQLFPDYSRPAIWTDGYYVPSSTGDEVIQKHACVADRTRMLRGEPATEQCLIVDCVNFLNNADIDGYQASPARRAEHHHSGGRHATEEAI